MLLMMNSCKYDIKKSQWGSGTRLMDLGRMRAIGIFARAGRLT